MEDMRDSTAMPQIVKIVRGGEQSMEISQGVLPINNESFAGSNYEEDEESIKIPPDAFQYRSDKGSSKGQADR
ncbi:hypothetical protein SLA2020_124250 [Shorea laevis]